MLEDTFIGEGPDMPEWQPAACEALDGHSIEIGCEGPETIVFGFALAVHDTTKPTRDNEE